VRSYPIRCSFSHRRAGKLVVLDEIHRMPALFEALRGVIDTGRRSGYRIGRFLILGSASIDLLRQFGEALAGRIEYVDLTPLCATEIDGDDAPRQLLWVRGGFPDSYLAANDADSRAYARASFAPIWNAMCRCSSHVSPPKPWSAFGSCWRTTKEPCLTPRGSPIRLRSLRRR